jgi:hypothetical protein
MAIEGCTPERAFKITQGDAGGFDPEDPYASLDDGHFLCAYAQKYFSEIGVTASFPTLPYPSIRDDASRTLTRNTSFENPSPFKRAAAFTLSFASFAPIQQTMSGSKVSPAIVEIANHQNILIPIEFSLYALGRGTIHHETRGNLVVENPLKVSNHYMTDLVHAVSCGSSDQFHFLSLVYEMITYKSNPEIEDKK